MPKVVTRLTDRKIKEAKPKDKEYNLSDGNGLMLRVLSSGTKRWYFNYQKPFTKKRTAINLGGYPEISLADARGYRDEYRALLAKREPIDPQDYRKAQEREQEELHKSTFKSVYELWAETRRETLTSAHLKRVHSLLDKYIFPSLANKPVGQIKAIDFIYLLRPLEAQGKLETVKKAIHNINGIMNYAVNYGLIEHNPAHAIREVFKKPQRTHMATLAPDQLPELMSALNFANIKLQTRCLVEWQLHTMVRPNEASGAKWDEIDLLQKLWVIPAERMKGRKGKKKEHIVPLTEQSMALLEVMRPISGQREHIFPNDHDPKKPMNSQSVNMALKRMGFKGRLVAHGLRALASTTLNEQGFNPDVIEACLAHVGGDEVRKAYNRATYLEQRVNVMTWWSEHIEQASQGNLSLAGAKNLRVVK